MGSAAAAARVDMAFEAHAMWKEEVEVIDMYVVVVDRKLDFVDKRLV